MGIFRQSILTALLLTVSACGGAPPPPAAPPESPPAPAASSAEPEAPKPAETAAPSAASEAPPAPTPGHDVWTDGMTKDQEVAFMKKNVVPEMEPVFKTFDAKRYDKFSCKTCHGPKFQVPKDFLPKLTFKDGKITAFASKPEIAKFMAEQVVPHMATALGLKPFDMATHTGFGCNGCHTVAMK